MKQYFCTNSKILSRYALALMGLGSFLMSSASFALPDFKVFPGASCQVEYSTNYGGGVSSWQLWGGAYSNTNTDLVGGYDHVICPIVRDKTTNLNGTQHVKVSIYNSANGRGFNCDLWSVDKYAGTNTAVQGFPVPMETYTATSPTTVGFYDLALNVKTSKASGYYALHCEVPPGGYIYRYEVGEYADTAVQ
ncbi:MAG: hypothetical protein ABL933_00560 [Methyloglobulus sp.]|nr:hypothetical protein [Methyloglobulus sp.]